MIYRTQNKCVEFNLLQQTMEYKSKSYYNKRNYLQICTYNGNFEDCITYTQSHLISKYSKTSIRRKHHKPDTSI